jgi:8-hydroxy-5-deazaflavin:NADPH oxidoreductase
MSKKVGILGSGQVAQTLANGFIKYGYKVKVGTREPSKLSNWLSKAGANGTVGTVEEAAAFGDILVLAVKGVAAESVVKKIAPHTHGKTILDATNPIAEAPPVNGVLKFFTTLDESLMERLQKLAPFANFVKCFSCVGNQLMVNPSLDGTMFICGNNDGAKKETLEILGQFGWEAIDMGKVESARAIEPLCILWCIPGFMSNQWMHAFKLVKPRSETIGFYVGDFSVGV